MDKLTKLQELLKLLQNDTVRPQEIKQFLELVLSVIKKSKDDFSNLSAENLQKITDAVQQIELQDSGKNLSKAQEVLRAVEQLHKETIDKVSYENSLSKNHFETKIQEVKGLMEQVKVMKPKDGYVPKKNVDYFDGKKGKDGLDGSPDTPKDIVIKLEGLAGDDRLDASAIKNLPEIPEFRPNGGGWRNLFQLHDVSISNPTNAQVLKYNSTTGVWENGTGGGSVGPGTINQIAYFDTTTSIASLPVATYPSLTELSYVKGVTSSIQTQLNAKGSGTVTSVTSADANATVATTTSTPVITIVSAPKLQTARTIGGVSFDGTANITVSTATGGFTVSGGDLALGANNITMTGSLGATGARLTKGWFTDLQVTNAIAGSITGNAATVTTNANLTGVITSVGNATSIASQTGTGTKFVVDTSPVLVTPNIGVATATTLAVGGATIGSNGLAVTGHLLLEGVTSTGATGTGLLVFGTSPTLTTAVLGSSTATTQAQNDNSTKLATTAYVDLAVLGQNFKEAVRVATTAALVGLYSNGSSGVGATFIYTATGTDVIDGVTLVLGDRVLVKNQGANDLQNGIYTVTTAGAIGVAGILTRATDANQSSEYKTGDSVFVTAGTTQTSTTWAYTGIDSPTMGTTSLTYVQVAGQGSFTAGNGISITGVSIAIDTTVTVDKTTAQTLTNKTLTAPVMTAPVLGTPASGVATNLTGTATGLTSGITNALKSATTTVDVSAATAPSSGQVLTATSSTAATWQTPSAAGGTVATIWATTFEADGRFSYAHTGSAADPSVGGLGLAVSSSGTANSSSTAQAQLATGSTDSIFDGSPTFSCKLFSVSATTDGQIFVGIGAVANTGTGHTFTNRHIGFKVIVSGSTASLYATQADGTTENASSALTTIAQNDCLDLMLVVNGTTNCAYYWKKNGGAWSSATTLSTNLPSANAAQYLQWSVNNANTATNMNIRVISSHYQR